MCTSEPEKIDDAIVLANKIESTLSLQMEKCTINSVQTNKKYDDKSNHDYNHSRSRKRSLTPFNKRFSSPFNQSRFRSKSRSKSRERVCYNCKKPGHFAKDCLANKGTNKESHKGSYHNKSKNLNC